MNNMTLRPMTQIEARVAVQNIKSHLAGAESHLVLVRRLAVELYERKGWIALDYPSWAACAEAEFGKSMRSVYNMLTSGIVERNIFADSANSELVIPDVVANELKTLEPDRQKAVFEMVKAHTPEGEITARRVKAGIAVYDEIVATNGHVDTGNGESSRIEAALTAEEHEILMRQKQHIAENANPKRRKVWGGPVAIMGTTLETNVPQFEHGIYGYAVLFKEIRGEDQEMPPHVLFRGRAYVDGNGIIFLDDIPAALHPGRYVQFVIYEDSKQ